MKYSLVDKNTVTVIKTKEFGDSVPPVFTQKSKPWVWVPFIKNNIESFDATTEVRLPFEEVVSLTEHTITASKRNKTQAELDADAELEKDSQIDDLSELRAIFEAIFNHENRIRALEGKQPRTRAQVKAFLRDAL